MPPVSHTIPLWAFSHIHFLWTLIYMYLKGYYDKWLCHIGPAHINRGQHGAALRPHVPRRPHLQHQPGHPPWEPPQDTLIKKNVQVQRSFLRKLNLDGRGKWLRHHLIKIFMKVNRSKVKDKNWKLCQGTSTEPEEPDGFAALLSEANSKLGWNSSSQSLYRVATQKCPNMLLTASWRVYSTNLRHTVYFYNSSVTPTDFGYCCSIYPYLDFDINNGSNAWHYVTADGSEDAKFTSKQLAPTRDNLCLLRCWISPDTEGPILERSQQRFIPDDWFGGFWIFLRRWI